MTSTILATFDDLRAANDAIRDLTDAGFERNDIGLAVYNNEQLNRPMSEQNMYDEDVNGGDGAGVGAIAGSIFGAIVGLATITIPGIGPVIAAGPLAAALGALAGAGVGAVSGAATGGIVASLVNLGIPEEDAHTYAESLRQGSALVSVNVYEVDADRATFILQKHHPVHLDQRLTDTLSDKSVTDTTNGVNYNRTTGSDYDADHDTDEHMPVTDPDHTTARRYDNQ